LFRRRRSQPRPPPQKQPQPEVEASPRPEPDASTEDLEAEGVRVTEAAPVESPPEEIAEPQESPATEPVPEVEPSPRPEGLEEQPEPRPEAGPGAGPPPRPGAPPARVVAIVNQKGGVGKSTTAVNLGAALAEMGKHVLVIDLDPQGNASTGLGIDPVDRQVGTYQVLSHGTPATSAVHLTAVEGVWAIPSTIDLAGAEIELVGQFSREMRLVRAIEEVVPAYDFVLLDCPPSLGLLTINALTAAGELIVPIQCEYYALEGLGQLLRNVRLVQQNLNPRLRLTGIVLTMYDSRTKLSEQVVEEVRRYFGTRVYDTIVPRTVRLSEAPGYGQPITSYDGRSKGAKAYRRLAKEVVERESVEEPLPEHEPPAVVSVQRGEEA
jgi:chromosome partitioning protein